jgi:hypothetical protein
MSPTVTIAELRGSIARCLDLCEQRLGPELDLGADHYWLVETDAAFDMTATPQLGVGQLTDDVESLRTSPARGPEDVWHELNHLLGPLVRLASLVG